MPLDSLVILGKDKNKIKLSPARKTKHPFGKEKTFLIKNPPILQMCSTESSDTTAQILSYCEAPKIVHTSYTRVLSPVQCSPSPHWGYLATSGDIFACYN